jgi:deferrochelatase/peroxidase EfeB
MAIQRCSRHHSARTRNEPDIVSSRGGHRRSDAAHLRLLDTCNSHDVQQILRHGASFEFV